MGTFVSLPWKKRRHLTSKCVIDAISQPVRNTGNILLRCSLILLRTVPCTLILLKYYVIFIVVDLPGEQCELCGKMFKTRVDMRKHRRTQHYKRYRYRCDKCGHGMEKESYLKTHKCERVRRKEVTDLHPGTEAMMIPPKSPQDTNNVQVPVPPPPRQQPRNNMVPLRQPEMVENQVQHTPENSHADNMAAAPSQHMPYNTVMPHLDYNHPVPMAPTSSHMMPGGQGGLDLMQRSMHDMRDLRWLTSDPDTTAMGQPDHNNPPMGLLPPEPPQNSGLHFMAYASQFASRISEMPQDFSQH